jgi:hypothetical protein
VTAPDREVMQQAPIDMLLYCPNCGMQHIDAPETPRMEQVPSRFAQIHSFQLAPTWDNPPHKSHLCHGCRCIWRPADVATNGVAELKTQGKADNWPAVHNEEVRAALARPAAECVVVSVPVCSGDTQPLYPQPAAAPQPPHGVMGTPLVPCPVCGGEAVHAQDVLARTVIQPDLRCICAEAPGGKCICGCGSPGVSPQEAPELILKDPPVKDPSSEWPWKTLPGTAQGTSAEEPARTAFEQDARTRYPGLRLIRHGDGYVNPGWDGEWRLWLRAWNAARGVIGGQVCPHGIHMDNACGACVPARGTTVRGVGGNDGR